MEMKPEWRKVQQLYENSDKVMIADVLCETDHEICSEYPDSGTPRVFWVTQGKESAVRYKNTYSFESFTEFIEKKLAPPVQIIPDHETYLQIRQNNTNISLIFIQEESNSVETLMTHLAKKFEKAPIRFFKFGYNEFNEAKIVYRFEVIDQTIEYTGKLSDSKAIEKFVELYSYPAITEANAFFLSAALKKTHFLLYYQMGETDNLPAVTETTKSLGTLRTGVIDCDKMNKVCRMFGINRWGGNQLVLIHGPKNRYYKFTGMYRAQNIRSWVEKALAGKEHALGPGAGWKGFFYNLKIEIKTAEFWKSAGIYTACFVFAVVVVKKIVACIIRWEKDDEIDEREREAAKPKNE